MKAQKMNKAVDEVVFILDGGIINEQIITEFDLSQEYGDYECKSDKKLYCNFVGFIANYDGKLLVALPKHYEDLSKFANDVGISDIKNLFKVIMTYKKLMSNNVGIDGNLINSTYPFEAFYGILDYYKKFGLYREKEKVTKPGYSGKISWRDTIRKSTKIFDNNNLLFFPLQVKKEFDKEVFLSECMMFALSYTIDRFSFFIEERVPWRQPENFDFWNNKQFVIQKLYQIRKGIFKDIHQRLVQSLIIFFSNLNNDGTFHLKHNKFENIWEIMVADYLNKHFELVDDDGLHFNVQQKKSTVVFTKHNEKIDIARGFELNPDHYYLSQDNSVQYIFDAKYYQSIDSLNYKQVSYVTLMKYKAKETHSALIAPIEDSRKNSTSKKHVETINESGHILIWEHYLSVKEVMNSFLNQV